jgi:hypothetical protein
MTRRDYIRAAGILREARAMHPDSAAAIGTVTAGLAAMFADDNPRFDRARFYDAAGIPATTPAEPDPFCSECGRRATVRLTADGPSLCNVCSGLA